MDIDDNNQNPVTTASYISGRIKYSRPQGLLWSDNPGSVSVDGIRFPNGREKEDYIILSDHNRSDISISQQRIETRQRMINGTMRSYHIADKINISVSWDMLPSRSFSRNVNFLSTGKSDMLATDSEYTVDGGAGGVELLDWYENHSGPFYVYLAYDKYNSPSFQSSGQVTDLSFQNLNVYNDIRLMYFSSFDYSIKKRGRGNHDFWSINVSLEEA